MNGTHLRDPGWGRLNLADGTDLIAGVARDTDVVATLKGELDIADLEDLAATFLGVLAGGLEDLIDEVICDVEDGLVGVSFKTS